jgi:hypothetical protein
MSHVGRGRGESGRGAQSVACPLHLSHLSSALGLAASNSHVDCHWETGSGCADLAEEQDAGGRTLSDTRAASVGTTPMSECLLYLTPLYIYVWGRWLAV